MNQRSALAVNGRVALQCDDGAFDLDDMARQISPAWLTQALSERYPGLVVLRSAIVRVYVGFSAKLWVEMEFNEAGVRAGLPRGMIVKTGFDRHDPIMRFSYENECLAYREFVPHYPVNAPECYFAGKAPNGRSAALILEDLLPRKVRFCHALTPLTFGEASAFLDAMARFHAATWNRPELLDGTAPFARQWAPIRAGFESFDRQSKSAANWTRYVALPRGAAVPMRLKDRDLIVEATTRLEAFGSDQAHVIVMGDEHLGNLYIEADGTPGFLDFQAGIRPWCRGVSYFLACGLDSLDRRRWERTLIARYLDRLALYGVEPPAFDDAFNAYSRFLLIPYVVFLRNGSSYQTEAVNTANAARAATAMIDTGTLGRLGL